MTTAENSSSATSSQAMLAAALAAIDEANSRDPNTLTHQGETQPKELCHGQLASEWLLRLDPDATPAQQLAARAHHLRRWEIPRDSYPKDRSGYLKWRTNLASFHAEETAAILRQVGFDQATIDRVGQIIKKRNLKGDPQVRTHEDVLCLVFLSTQLGQLDDDMETDKLIDVLAKTMKKMSPQGREQASRLSYDNRQRRLFAKALEVSKSL